MNERFKELADEAFKGLGTNPVYATAMIYASKELEKFAELLVKECVTFCEHESNDDEHDEYDMGMWVKAQSIKTAIMEHFGVDK